jgi:two-component system, OmpR family, sensor kinase
MTKTLRFRMMVLFCSVVGILLAASYGAFWILLAQAIPKQLNRQLLETAQPILSDIASEPNARDIERLDIPGQFFEVLDGQGSPLQRSHNLAAAIDLRGLQPSPRHPVFGLAFVGNADSLRVGLIPFAQSGEQRYLAVAIPTFGTNRVLDSFGRIALLLFPLSLVLTAAISALYVGRSLRPIDALTRHAALAAKRVTNRQGFWTPLPVISPHDELGRLAGTFNHLLESVDASVKQLRQFVTDASHELRTPLAVLHGETELTLSRPRTASEYRKTLAAFEDELKKLTRIVEGLFTLSMADAGQLHLLAEPLYVNEVLEEACVLVSSKARANGIAIVGDLDEEIHYVGDEAFLHQLFLIFLDNAIKYSSPNSRVHVKVEVRNQTVRVQFSDQGRGIAPEHLPHIFDRFYRAPSSNNGSETHGGGLGLAIAQAIVRALGGAIECESELGAGSTFTIRFPLQNQITEPAKQKLIYS